MNSMQATEAVYFEEGEGFYYIKHIGSGVDGNVTLVSNGPSKQLFARKESHRNGPCTEKEGKWYLELPGPLPPNHSEKPEDLSQPSKEVRIARQLAAVTGVCKVRGWCRNIDTINKQVVSSSYWDYYNGGSVKALFIDERPLPEYWVSQIVHSMAKTLIQVHSAGFTHQDCHADNWFWEHVTVSGKDQINVVLGDFTRARTRQELGMADWNELCRLEFDFLVRIALELLSLPAHLVGDGHMVPIVPYSSDVGCTREFWDLLHDLKNPVNATDDTSILIQNWTERLNQHHQRLPPTVWPCPIVRDANEWYTPLEVATAGFHADMLKRPKYWQTVEIGPDIDAATLRCSPNMPDSLQVSASFMKTYSVIDNFYID